MADDLQTKVKELTAENADLKAQIDKLTEQLKKVMKCGEHAQGLLGGADEAKEKTTDKAEEAAEKKKQDAQKAQDAVKGALGSFGF